MASLPLYFLNLGATIWLVYFDHVGTLPEKMVHCGKYLSVVVGQYQNDQVTKMLSFQVDSKNSIFYLSAIYKLNKGPLTC